ncbi:hypothetical protein PEX1_043280 [Penicillium expansum]|uniref:DUF6546 domain-containing protein n=1 Tax=Penicillium expansum TaxID=27334 RepID=A0A0A2I2S8_PENEN|nr:hypothetical protein PEX2_023170 [Penicillium expansum]KGO36686.1 hypothetical protein PEX1_043280 [Penicillium expansum]KGO48309.1 hypothetical protein PEXP_041290 [Penicillium expansum]KGO53789.1 hypothetical protein PEX2_023170 [Penicillium expansum]
MAFSLLPLEIKIIILGYLIAEAEEEDRLKLAPFAAVNREWQEVFEKCIFEHINLSTRARLAHFNRRSWVRTRSLVQSIDLTVELERYYDHGDAHCRYENEDEQRRNNKIFTASIQSLFDTLSKWPRRDGKVFAVYIETQSPDDKSAQPPEAWEERRLRARESHDFLDKRFERSWLQFDENLVGVRCASVPLINCLVVTGGQIRRDDLRKIEPVSCSLIMEKLPRLHDLTLYLDDRSTWNPELRYRHRKGLLSKEGSYIITYKLTANLDFADSIPRWPRSLTCLTLDFPFDEPSDEFYPPPTLTVEGNPDPLSSRLHELSQRLRELHADRGVFGREVFWPLVTLDKDKDNTELPTWSELKRMTLSYVPITPGGTRMFEKKEPEQILTYQDPTIDLTIYEEMDNTDLDWVPPEQRRNRWFRRKPNHEMFNQYFLAVGKAALRMPKLIIMKVEVVECINMLGFRYEVRDGVAKVTWLCDWDLQAFEISNDVLQIWEKVAYQHTGRDLELKVDGY